MSDTPTLERLDRDLDDLVGLVEGQQQLIEFLFQVLAQNLPQAEQKAALRRALIDMTAHYERDPENPATEAKPIRRVLAGIAQPRPKLTLVRGGLYVPPPATD